LGIGRTRSNEVTLFGGTFWQMTVTVDRPLIDPEARLRTGCHVLPGKWMAEAMAFYAGLTLRWFRDAFCDAEKRDAALRGVDPFVIMEEEASEAPLGANGIVPIFSNLMDVKRWVQSSPAFIGFDIGNPEGSGRRECIRAIEESAAFASLGNLRMIESLIGHEVDEIVFTGGGSKGQLWPRIVADVLGVRVKVPVVKESSALGAALCAGVGAGLFHDVAGVARRVVRFEKTHEPDLRAHAEYERLYERWRGVYLRMLEITEAGLVRPLWWPPGA
jgi:autoinducer 2 (AI-2) kinase